MSNALSSDVEARAERRRTRTRDDMWRELSTKAWQRGNAAADLDVGRRWLERAHRMLPDDGLVALSLAGVRLRVGALADALALFEREAGRHGTVQAWTGLVTCAHLLGQSDLAREALTSALQSHAPLGSLAEVANAVAQAPGWCGLTGAGVLHAVLPGSPAVRLDGAPTRLAWRRDAARLPAGWHKVGSIEVDGVDGPLIGSPLSPARFLAVEGFVEAIEGGIEGWAWHPADPGLDPVLIATGDRQEKAWRATAPAEGIQGIRPLARPRRFSLSADEVAALGAPLSIRGADGRNLLGSPLDPGLEARAASEPGHAGFAPVWADLAAAPRIAPVPRPAPVDVVIPVFGGGAVTLACLDSVLASVPRGTRVIVVDDAGRDLRVAAALDRLARRRRVVLLRLDENRGFPGAANAGLRVASGHDVVLLNSDTLVPPGWLERLRAAAYQSPDIGTVTPLSNDATIVSYPALAGNTAPDLAGTVTLDALSQRANAGVLVDLPVGVGFCLYIRHDCLAETGLLREDLFAQGYGEENDFCLRARRRGFRHVAAASVFVAHVGAATFGGARSHLVRRNGAVLGRLHPGYDDLVARHEQADPLFDTRRRMDGLRWAQGRCRDGAVIIATHAGGGGVDQVVVARAARVRAAGQRPIVLRPARTAAGLPAVRVDEPGGEAVPNLVYAMPDALPALARLLRPDRPVRFELHHMLGHDSALPELAARLGIPLDSVVHDYARFCPRIALVGPTRRYCGEPDLAGCEACIADIGSLLEDDPPVRVLLARSAAELAGAARVIAPSGDAAARMRRHFPDIRPVVEPWEDDTALPPLAPLPDAAIRRVVVVGAVGVEKGYDLLLGCVRDAKARTLPLEFVVVGFTADDERLMDAGPVFVTGEYHDSDAVALIRSQQAQVGFIPSIWPETWCFALSRLWQAGLAAAVFDLGAQAERVRRTGRGWTLPLGLPHGAVNDMLLRLAPSRLKPLSAHHSMPL